MAESAALAAVCGDATIVVDPLLCAAQRDIHDHIVASLDSSDDDSLCREWDDVPVGTPQCHEGTDEEAVRDHPQGMTGDPMFGVAPLDMRRSAIPRNIADRHAPAIPAVVWEASALDPHELLSGIENTAATAVVPSTVPRKTQQRLPWAAAGGCPTAKKRRSTETDRPATARKKPRITHQSAKAKGRRLQQQVRDKLLRRMMTLDGGITELDVKSTSMGCGGEDVTLSSAAQRMFPYSIECKNKETLVIWSALRQCDSNARDLIPLVVTAKARTKPYAVIPFIFLTTLLSKRLNTDVPALVEGLPAPLEARVPRRLLEHMTMGDDDVEAVTALNVCFKAGRGHPISHAAALKRFLPEYHLTVVRRTRMGWWTAVEAAHAPARERKREPLFVFSQTPSIEDAYATLTLDHFLSLALPTVD